MKVCELHNDCYVLFEGRRCPVCDLESDKDSFEADNVKLETEIIRLEDKLSNLNE